MSRSSITYKQPVKSVSEPPVVVVDTLDRKEGKKSWLREADRGRKLEPEKEKLKKVGEKKRREKVINHITGGRK